MTLTVGGLTAEHLVDPLGLDTVRPRLSWLVADDRGGTRQVAYRLRSAAWDSGRVESPDCADVRYGGPEQPRVE